MVLVIYSIKIKFKDVKTRIIFSLFKMFDREKSRKARKNGYRT